MSGGAPLGKVNSRQIRGFVRFLLSLFLVASILSRLAQFISYVAGARVTRNLHSQKSLPCWASVVNFEWGSPPFFFLRFLILFEFFWRGILTFFFFKSIRQNGTSWDSREYISMCVITRSGKKKPSVFLSGRKRKPTENAFGLVWLVEGETEEMNPVKRRPKTMMMIMKVKTIPKKRRRNCCWSTGRHLIALWPFRFAYDFSSSSSSISLLDV